MFRLSDANLLDDAVFFSLKKKKKILYLCAGLVNIVIAAHVNTHSRITAVVCG